MTMNLRARLAAFVLLAFACLLLVMLGGGRPVRVVDAGTRPSGTPGGAIVFTTGAPNGSLRGPLGQVAIDRATNTAWQNTNGARTWIRFISTAQVEDSSVTTAKIAADGVTTTDILDSNVTTAKIADSNVTTVKIADSNVTTAKIAASNITTALIADANVTLAKLADLATARFIGRTTAGTGVPESMTTAQATALLDTFSTSAATKGVVPGSSGGGATVFLNGNGGWTAPPAGSDARLITQLLASDYTNSTATATEVTGLTENLAAGTYQFVYSIILRQAVQTSGFKSSVAFDGTQTILVANHRFVGFNSTGSLGIDQDQLNANLYSMQGYSQRGSSTAGMFAVTQVDTSAADHLLVVEGLVKVTVTGNLELWMASEDTNQVKAMAGSTLVVTKVE